MSDVHAKITSLGYTLPDLPTATGNYQPWIIDGGVFKTSGQLSRDGDTVLTGPVPSKATADEARHAATVSILRCLCLLDQGSDGFKMLDRIISLRGYIAADPGFTDQSKVLDAVLDLLVDIFGDSGRHIRSAIGVASLPANGLVELELEARLRE